MSQLNVGTIVTTEGVRLPAFSSANRPSNPQLGLTIYNTDKGAIEFFDGTVWATFGGNEVVASGGNSIQDINGFRIHTFTGDGNFNVTTAGGKSFVEYLIVAGGGAGGSRHGGGGGAGGVLMGHALVSIQNYPVQVGAGAAGLNTHIGVAPSGLNSTVFGLTAFGGGGGGRWQTGSRAEAKGVSGGCGGGAGGGTAVDSSRTRMPGGREVQGQGYPGGHGIRFTSDNTNAHAGGGGGGAGGPGYNCEYVNHSAQTSFGGIGVYSDINGTGYYWAGGGGTGVWSGNLQPGDGGLGGGGGGGRRSAGGAGGGQALNIGNAGGNDFGGNAGANTGGGGGGNGGQSADVGGSPGTGGSGGSGIVIIRYRI